VRRRSRHTMHSASGRAAAIASDTAARLCSTGENLERAVGSLTMTDDVTSAIDTFLADVPADPTEQRGRLFDLGLAWVNHPVGRGGLDAPGRRQLDVLRRIQDQGLALPTLASGGGVALAGPTMAVHGSDDVCRRLLRRSFTGEDSWCQLFSEPVSGSDMAGLATRAVRDGDEWVVDGQKVWTTNAHLCNRAMLIARTDPELPKHAGITYFGLDLHAPGVDVRPLRQMTGQAEFSEVFLTGVRVPDADRIGDVGDGWRVAMTTLSSERTSIGGGGRAPARGSGAIAEALRIWTALPATRRTPAARDRLVRMWSHAETLRLTNLRASAAARSGQPGPEGSISKLAFATINQDIYELCVDLLGADALVDYDYGFRRDDHLGYVGPPGTARQFFLRTRANSIEGGTSEIQRNIVGERVLGLPREPDPFKGAAWRDVPRS
jgi:alkylation response protein AidB-like acyl-CoA dehydrogenase